MLYKVSTNYLLSAIFKPDVYLSCTVSLMYLCWLPFMPCSRYPNFSGVLLGFKLNYSTGCLERICCMVWLCESCYNHIVIVMRGRCKCEEQGQNASAYTQAYYYFIISVIISDRYHTDQIIILMLRCQKYLTSKSLQKRTIHTSFLAKSTLINFPLFAFMMHSNNFDR